MEKLSFEKFLRQVSSNQSSTMTLYKLIKFFQNNKNISDEEFFQNSGLNKAVLENLKNNVRTSISKLMSICIGLKLSASDATTLLARTGYILVETRREECAYRIILENSEFFNWDMEKCNEFLKRLKIPKRYLLGSIEYNKENYK